MLTCQLHHHRRPGGVRAHGAGTRRVRVSVAVVTGVLEAGPVDSAGDEAPAAAAVDQMVAHHLEPRSCGVRDRGHAQASDRDDQSRRDPGHSRSTQTGKAFTHATRRIGPMASRLDHVGLDVSDYEASKAFYEQALAPLGIALMMEPIERIGGFGGRVPLLLDRAARAGPDTRHPRRLSGPDRETVEPSTRPRWPPAGSDNGAPGPARELPPALLRRVRARPRRQQRRGRLPYRRRVTSR